MKACRVCRRPVTPWRRGWRRPTTTIHEGCLRRPCGFCGVEFVVGKERKGLFCCNEHQWSFRTFGCSAADAEARGQLA